MNPDHPGEARKEAERAELEVKIRATIAQNQDVLNTVPKEASDVEYWSALRREGTPRLMRVSRLDSDEIDAQPEMYILQEEGGHIEVTYFREDGEIGESFWISMDRIKAVE